MAPSSSVCALNTMPSRRLPSSRASRFLRSPSGKDAEDLAVELEQVERVQHRLGDGPAPMQGVEYRNPVRTAHHRHAGPGGDSRRV